MKQQRGIIEKVSKQLVKHITEKEVYGWPPLCPALCYQPVRPRKESRDSLVESGTAKNTKSNVSRL